MVNGNGVRVCGSYHAPFHLKLKFWISVIICCATFLEDLSKAHSYFPALVTNSIIALDLN